MVVLIEPSKVLGEESPIIDVFQKRFCTNTPHVVYPARNLDSPPDVLVLFVSGTGTAPIESELYLKSLNITSGLPVIGLSYIFGGFADAERNGVIRSRCTGGEKAVQTILKRYHEDVLFSGRRSGLVDISTSQCMIARLGALLEHLAQSRPPHEGWSRFLGAAATDHNTEVRINFERVICVGFSQGAGHLAYLATRYALYGLVLVAGTQEAIPRAKGGDSDSDSDSDNDNNRDNDSDVKSWLSEASFLTENVVAVKHARDETAPLMDSNWEHIPPLGLTAGRVKGGWGGTTGGGALTDTETIILPIPIPIPSSSSSSSSTANTAATVTVEALGRGTLSSPSLGRRCCFNVLTETGIIDNTSSSSCRPFHCSLTLDHSTPDVDTKEEEEEEGGGDDDRMPAKLFYRSVWPFIMGQVLRHPPSTVSRI